MSFERHPKVSLASIPPDQRIGDPASHRVVLNGLKQVFCVEERRAIRGKSSTRPNLSKCSDLAAWFRCLYHKSRTRQDRLPFAGVVINTDNIDIGIAGVAAFFGPRNGHASGEYA